MAKRAKLLYADGGKKAREIAQWKEIVAERWDAIHVVSSTKEDDMIQGVVQTGRTYKVQHVIDEAGLNDAIGVELVTTYVDEKGRTRVKSIEPMKVVKQEGNLYTFELDHEMQSAGTFKVAYRMFPKNADLPHRQDFCYVKWFN
jgi:starch phosphorylase